MGPKSLVRRWFSQEDVFSGCENTFRSMNTHLSPDSRTPGYLMWREYWILEVSLTYHCESFKIPYSTHTHTLWETEKKRGATFSYSQAKIKKKKNMSQPAVLGFFFTLLCLIQYKLWTFGNGKWCVDSLSAFVVLFTFQAWSFSQPTVPAVQ